jgi:hypothetical protein
VALRRKRATRIPLGEGNPSGVRRMADLDDRADGKNLKPHSERDIITESPLQPDPFVALKTAVSESDLSFRSMIEPCLKSCETVREVILGPMCALYPPQHLRADPKALSLALAAYPPRLSDPSGCSAFLTRPG